MLSPLRILRYDLATFAVNGFGLFQATFLFRMHLSAFLLKLNHNTIYFVQLLNN